MALPVSVALNRPKIIEIDKKYNKKMQVSSYILAGWLLDGSTAVIREKALLETKNHRIAEIRKPTEEDLARNDLLDLSDCTLLPGLVDAHVHLILSGSREPSVRQRQLTASFSSAKPVIQKHLDANVCCGVVALRDGGDYGGYALRYKRERLCGTAGEPEVRAAGKAWHAPGRYGRLVGRPPYPNRSLGGSIARGQKQSDHVKIVNSGLNSLVDFGRQTSPQFSQEDLSKAVSCAHQMGLKVMIHANGTKPVREAVGSGCDSIEHGFFMGIENLRRMAEKQVTWVPTVFTMEAYARMLPRKMIRERDVARKTLEHQLNQIRRAKDFGVSVALGTDAGSLGVDHGEAVREELRLFIMAGMNLATAVRCATSRGAALLGLQKGSGRLVPGSPATFLAVRAKPDNLLDRLGSPERVYVKGVRVCPPCSEGRPQV